MTMYLCLMMTVPQKKVCLLSLSRLLKSSRHIYEFFLAPSTRRLRVNGTIDGWRRVVTKCRTLITCESVQRLPVSLLLSHMFLYRSAVGATLVRFRYSATLRRREFASAAGQLRNQGVGVRRFRSLAQLVAVRRRLAAL